MSGTKEEFYKITEQVDLYCARIKESIQAWKKTVLRQDVEKDDLKTRSKSKEGVEKDIDQLVIYLKGFTIDSYKFTYGANQAAQSLNDEICDFLLGRVRAFSHPAGNKVSRDDAFIAYYLLSYIFKLYEPEKLKSFLGEYEKFFQEHYALVYQIRGRALRAKGKLDEAIQNDRLALEKLKEEGIDNIGIKVTYASSVAVALENGQMEIEPDEISNSISDVKKAIQMNREYSRYHYLLAKLRLYQIRNEVYRLADTVKSVEEWSKSKKDWICGLGKAGESIQTALNLLNKQAPSYTEFFVTYRETADYIKRLQMEIDLWGKLYEQRHKFEEEARKNAESLKENIEKKAEESVTRRLKQEKERIAEENQSRLNEIQNKMQAELERSQMKYLEILAVFVAIVGVMVTTNGLLTKFSFNEAIIGIIIMNAGIVAVYTCFKIIFAQDEIHKMYKVILLVTCAIILVALLLGNWISIWRP